MADYTICPECHKALCKCPYEVGEDPAAQPFDLEKTLMEKLARDCKEALDRQTAEILKSAIHRYSDDCD
jgi:hypothetical protein